ncbi:unnamed protein product [Owenia fusiformis]|uniref:Uncharacterized protein n=1 Tax=Owenia fusiformis TaxID=6347 RepID=A0A8J1U8A1_OWEFU|nr:unnamed protein product [Owenia fusiformis]
MAPKTKGLGRHGLSNNQKRRIKTKTNKLSADSIQLDNGKRKAGSHEKGRVLKRQRLEYVEGARQSLQEETNLEVKRWKEVCEERDELKSKIEDLKLRLSEKDNDIDIIKDSEEKLKKLNVKLMGFLQTSGEEIDQSNICIEKCEGKLNDMLNDNQVLDQRCALLEQNKKIKKVDELNKTLKNKSKNILNMSQEHFHEETKSKIFSILTFFICLCLLFFLHVSSLDRGKFTASAGSEFSTLDFKSTDHNTIINISKSFKILRGHMQYIWTNGRMDGPKDRQTPSQSHRLTV